MGGNVRNCVVPCVLGGRVGAHTMPNGKATGGIIVLPRAQADHAQHPPHLAHMQLATCQCTVSISLSSPSLPASSPRVVRLGRDTLCIAQFTLSFAPGLGLGGHGGLGTVGAHSGPRGANGSLSPRRGHAAEGECVCCGEALRSMGQPIDWCRWPGTMLPILPSSVPPASIPAAACCPAASLASSLKPRSWPPPSPSAACPTWHAYSWTRTTQRSPQPPPCDPTTHSRRRRCGRRCPCGGGGGGAAVIMWRAVTVGLGSGGAASAATSTSASPPLPGRDVPLAFSRHPYTLRTEAGEGRVGQRRRGLGPYS